MFDLLMTPENFLRARFASEMGLPAVAGVAAICDEAAKQQDFDLKTDEFAKLPENLASDNPFFQDNIADLTDLIMAVLEIQVNSIIDPFQDENSLYAFCMGFLISRKHAPSKEMVETILIVKPFIQDLLDKIDGEQSSHVA